MDFGGRSSRAADCRAPSILPLLSGGKVLGTLTLARLAGGDSYSPLEVSLAEDLAGRIALALDNANLVRSMREGDRRKDEFLATLSHELRNPLAAITSALQCLEINSLPPEVLLEARAILKRQTQHVVRLVEDLLDVSRITRGKIRLRKENVELAALVERAVSSVRPLVDQRRQQLTVSLPDASVRLYGDPTRLEQVIGNLLNNAAKYTPPGGCIELLAELEAERIAIRVKDTGAGIAPELLPVIFDLFAQGDRTLDHSQGGLGIGLTLVRNLVALHRGEVTASSPGSGRGSEFVVRLPVVSSPHVEHEANGQSPLPLAETIADNGRRVLVVDDNVDLAATTATLLRSLGHDVHFCHDGRAALRLLDEVQPEVMLVDIGMPEMSGHDVARTVRQRPDCDDLLLVAMTGYGQAEDRRRTRESGFNVHLVKPVGLPALEELLRSARPDKLLSPATQAAL